MAERSWNTIAEEQEYAMRDEWVAWRFVCTELDELSIDINDQAKLHAALVLWGESLATLRTYQDVSDRAEWLNDARRAYSKRARV